LEALPERPGFEINTRIEPPVFDDASILLPQPTLVSFCTLHASIKCFSFLVASGANLTLKDAGKRFLSHFAITSGNQEIIRKTTEVLNNFAVATVVSAEFQRFELFRIFLITEATDLKANDIKNGSVFHGIAATNHIRMILFCIEQVWDVNLTDSDGWTPLNCAIEFCALESVLVLT
jgi:ankyrin repeat protein